MQGKPIEFDFKQEASSTINTGQLKLTKQITDPNDINLQIIKDVRPAGPPGKGMGKRDRMDSKQN